MRLSEPRVPPVSDPNELDDGARDLLTRYGSDGRVPNIFATLIRHPKLLKRWSVFGNHVLAKSALDPIERELAILRVGALCECDYEFVAHTAIGKGLGMEEDVIERVRQGPDADGWSELERTLLTAVDELHRDCFISDQTWKSLAEHYNEQQLMDLIFAVGQYHLVSMALNSLGVQLDEGGFPA